MEILSWKSEWEQEMINNGAVEINADQPLGDVVEMILKLI